MASCNTFRFFFKSVFLVLLPIWWTMSKRYLNRCFIYLVRYFTVYLLWLICIYLHVSFTDIVTIDVPFCECGSMIVILHRVFWFSWFPVPNQFWSNFLWFSAFHKIQLSVGMEYLLKWWWHLDCASGLLYF